MATKLPKGIIPPAPRGPRARRGAGPHASTPNRRRTRGQAKQAAIREQQT